MGNKNSGPKKGSTRTKGSGRKAGTPNKSSKLLKDAILEAAEAAGDKEGMVGYLKDQAQANPGPFMALLGKVIPLQVEGTGEDGEINIKIVFE
mgnify:FL=1|tara:strand:- start:959 stop:1237 length:279 start_codon:yes stop_codon:yes gene_type:complete